MSTTSIESSYPVRFVVGRQPVPTIGSRLATLEAQNAALQRTLDHLVECTEALLDAGQKLRLCTGWSARSGDNQ